MKHIVQQRQNKRFKFQVSRFKFQEGMSLVEIIISVFLILILFSLLIMEFGALSISRSQRLENIAYHVANKQMEDLRSTLFSDLPSSGNISDTLLDEIPSGSGTFSLSDSSDYDGLKELVVTVNWNDGNSKSVVLKTLIGDGGLNPQ